MPNNHFIVLRSGTHTSFQDEGFFNVQHLGITAAGVIDYELYTIANKILGNIKKQAAIEFSFQGPLLKLSQGNCRFVITGDVNFNIISKDKIFKGICNRTYNIKKGDIIDIITTINTNYGYFAIEGGFNLESDFNSFSTLTQSKIGTNNGNNVQKNQYIFFTKNGSNKISKIKLNEYVSDNIIRVIRGPQMHYFMLKVIKKFYQKDFIISKNANRMGIRLIGNSIQSIKSHNIDSEGVIKGSIQVPGSMDPIVLINDHPTIGGYPKIATVIMSDISKLAQYPIGKKFKFKEVTLLEAENIYQKYLLNLNNILKDIEVV